jgi:hypothetical protein
VRNPCDRHRIAETPKECGWIDEALGPPLAPVLRFAMMFRRPAGEERPCPQPPGKDEEEGCGTALGTHRRENRIIEPRRKG